MTMLAAEIDFNRLNNLLWRYRACLDRFEFLLEMQLAVTASGRQDWQHHMADLLEELATTIGRLDLERAVIVGEQFNLTELAANAPELWSGVLTEQQAHLATATAQISRLRQRNDQAITAGSAGLRQLIDAIAEASGAPHGGAPESYGGDGRMKPQGGSPLLFDGRA
jgi:hypothetical protein